MTRAQKRNLGAAIVSLLIAVIHAATLYIKLNAQNETINHQKQEAAKNTTSIEKLSESVKNLSENGLTTAGVFSDGLMSSLVSLLDNQITRHTGHLRIITDCVMYGCVSHPEEFNTINDHLAKLIKGTGEGQNRTGVTMLVYSDTMEQKALELQYSDETWLRNVAGKKDGALAKTFAKWVNREDVQMALSSSPLPAPKMLDFRNGVYAADDRKAFLECVQIYNKFMQQSLIKMGVALYTCDDPLPFHLWLAEKPDDTEAVSGIVSIADWASCIDEPGFKIHKAGHSQFGTIADQLFDSAKKLSPR